MANRVTSTKTFSLTGEAAATVTDEPIVRSREPEAADLADRLRNGALTASDDLARVNGVLGGAVSDQALSEALVAATGGHDNISPVTNPEKPANPVELAFHPGVDRLLVKGA